MHMSTIWTPARKKHGNKQSIKDGNIKFYLQEQNNPQENLKWVYQPIS
jgi:hypothetical protein